MYDDSFDELEADNNEVNADHYNEYFSGSPDVQFYGDSTKEVDEDNDEVNADDYNEYFSGTLPASGTSTSQATPTTPIPPTAIVIPDFLNIQSGGRTGFTVTVVVMMCLFVLYLARFRFFKLQAADGEKLSILGSLGLSFQNDWKSIANHYSSLNKGEKPEELLEKLNTEIERVILKEKHDSNSGFKPLSWETNNYFFTNDDKTRQEIWNMYKTAFGDANGVILKKINDTAGLYENYEKLYTNYELNPISENKASIDEFIKNLRTSAESPSTDDPWYTKLRKLFSLLFLNSHNDKSVQENIIELYDLRNKLEEESRKYFGTGISSSLIRSEISNIKDEIQIKINKISEFPLCFKEQVDAGDITNKTLKYIVDDIEKTSKDTTRIGKKYPLDIIEKTTRFDAETLEGKVNGRHAALKKELDWYWPNSKDQDQELDLLDHLSSVPKVIKDNVNHIYTAAYQENFENAFVRAKGGLILFLVVISLMYQTKYSYAETKYAETYLGGGSEYIGRAMGGALLASIMGTISAAVVMGMRGGHANGGFWSGDHIKGINLMIVAVIFFLFEFAKESSGLNRYMANLFGGIDKSQYAEIDFGISPDEDDPDNQLQVQAKQAIATSETTGDPFVNSIGISIIVLVGFAIVGLAFDMIGCTYFGYKSNDNNILGEKGYGAGKFSLEFAFVLVANIIPLLVAPVIRKEGFEVATGANAAMLGLIIAIQLMFHYTGLLTPSS
jgi:hypothetical protein